MNTYFYNPDSREFSLNVGECPEGCIVVDEAEMYWLVKHNESYWSAKESKDLETQWQQEQLNSVAKEIERYQLDSQVPEAYSELRVTNYSESEYYALLGDRKLLVEYLEQPDFPECGRPTLSGLANASQVTP
ncbi:hypothetical protein R7D96_13015 [Vibrio sp. Vb2853]|uniref:hypothetical protein n=1 Tax=unclassified Vibrio TaxID=2614977 RepID=UPI002964EC2B|nr:MULTISPECIES: hypothetical protein [unclassified Vibrio]MDW1615047.1 hypothetical protein [Vibrio sp. Vb2881]MDW1619763.1 hypothetical protein [Vibrio sp. Vb2864]MDW1691897.1 hypothetical protein [Vibrio sp. Vb2853]MDW1710607.1 hypothetical protein [Vibrio sp. Vb2865]MDW1715728.1 hypothetical protein [Vibrio sp. Vb2873]